jgi:hypothetical protein
MRTSDLCARIAKAAAFLALIAGAGCDSSDSKTRSAVVNSAPHVYLVDPGLKSAAVRPQYISFPIASRTWMWIRDLRWIVWGGDTASGLGMFEICAEGRCKRDTAEVHLEGIRPMACSSGSAYTRITYIADERQRTRQADTCKDD